MLKVFTVFIGSICETVKRELDKNPVTTNQKKGYIT